MHTGSFAFAQLTSFLNRSLFNRIVAKYDGDKYVKHFSCWNQLLTLMFGQLTGRNSLRDLVTSLEGISGKWKFLGLGSQITKSNLSKANNNRNHLIFEEFASYMMREARMLSTNHALGLNADVYAFDSTTIPLCLNLFDWAKFRKHKGGVKVHTLFDVETQIPAFTLMTTASVYDSTIMGKIPYESGSYYIFDRGYNNFKELYHIHLIGAYFVVRAKNNVQYKAIKWKRRLPDGVRSDAEIEFAKEDSKEKCPVPLREVRYVDKETGREFIFLTNIMHLPSTMIAELYRNRWQVELFFKWIKQHLKIKKFYGTTENAVRIQIHVAIITYCLVAIAKQKMKIERSIYEMLQILSITLTEKTLLRELFEKPNFNDVKDQIGPSEPTLFD